MIRHVSFDVWNTLIKSDPRFAPARDDILAKTFGMDPITVRTTYKRVKNHLDEIAEDHGVHYDAQGVYGMLFDELGVSSGDGWEGLRSELELLFEAYPPVIAEAVVAALRELSGKGYTLSIGSNTTNFISGSVIQRVVLDRIGVPWAYMIFSDAVGCCKPHSAFFDIVKDRAASVCGVSSEGILHVGDNPVADVQGALRAGIRSFLVAGPGEVPGVLMEV